MCICISISMYVCVYIYIYIHISLFLSLSLSLYIYIYIYTEAGGCAAKPTGLCSPRVGTFSFLPGPREGDTLNPKP